MYLNQGGHWAEVSPLRLCGSPDSMFGISLAVLGDLNQDGFPGVAWSWKGSGEGGARGRMGDKPQRSTGILLSAQGEKHPGLTSIYQLCDLGQVT